MSLSTKVAFEGQQQNPLRLVGENARECSNYWLYSGDLPLEKQGEKRG
jgi:hypothetical protein